MHPDKGSFKPDITIDRRTELKIGGTRIELIPVRGGETHDAMFIYLPDEGVLFVGDFIMPGECSAGRAGLVRGER